MRFILTLHTEDKPKNRYLPINYQYPLSAAIYRIISNGDSEYANFLHETGYGKGFKLFTFSQLNVPFKIEKDRLKLTGNEAILQVSFHLPEAMENFVKGLFMSEQIEVADKKSKVIFSVKSILSLPNPLQQHKENEIIETQLKALSPIVAGIQNEKGNYDFLSPENKEFTESLIYNWRNKIATCFDDATASSALLMAEVIPMKNPVKSRLITIKADTPQETKIRGWMSFGLKITAERRFIELLLNSGVGVYNALGMGCVEVVEK